MTDKQANFLSEFFKLMARYNVSFEGTEEPVYVNIDNIRIGHIVNENNNTLFCVDVTCE